MVTAPSRRENRDSPRERLRAVRVTSGPKPTAVYKRRKTSTPCNQVPSGRRPCIWDIKASSVLPKSAAWKSGGANVGKANSPPTIPPPQQTDFPLAQRATAVEKDLDVVGVVAD